jgi:serine/threonine-protein kinase
VGRVLAGKYEFVRLLGAGGMGEVHEAVNTATGRRVAVKIVRVSEKTEEVVQRFRREGRALGAVTSSHIVQILDAGEDPDTDEPFMVMELLAGEDASSLHKRLAPLPVDLAVRIVAQAALGVGQAHACGIVHRDIKPANVFLAEEPGGRRMVKLLDFGVAGILEGDVKQMVITARKMTRTGTIVGTVQYMAPEQLRGLKNIDTRADVWGLGVVLYRLLTGRLPHEIDAGPDGPNANDVLLAICTTPAHEVQEHAPWVPPEVADVVHRALSIDPRSRYRDGTEMYEALAALCTRGTEIRADMIVTLDSRERIEAPRRKAPPKAAVPAKFIELPKQSKAKKGRSQRARLPVEEPSHTALSVGAARLVRRTRWVVGLGGALFLGAAAVLLFAGRTESDAGTPHGSRVQNTSASLPAMTVDPAERPPGFTDAGPSPAPSARTTSPPLR